MLNGINSILNVVMRAYRKTFDPSAHLGHGVNKNANDYCSLSFLGNSGIKWTTLNNHSQAHINVVLPGVLCIIQDHDTIRHLNKRQIRYGRQNN